MMIEIEQSFDPEEDFEKYTVYVNPINTRLFFVKDEEYDEDEDGRPTTETRYGIVIDAGECLDNMFDDNVVTVSKRTFERVMSEYDRFLTKRGSMLTE